ncbi:isocitrate/isopropylmalate family dehydrogenase [Streptomyces diastaticus]|uniref:isocitrate/isopropylmalate family dehydrogenase n=1 Tax=Streptomyces diastaticus TaxID=1956 RepID=UPI003650B570
MPPVVGLAVGHGTGAELAEVFTRVLGVLTRDHPTGVTLVRSPRLYHSYHSLCGEGAGEPVATLTREDTDHYEGFCRSLAARGAGVVFRTAVNAQSLYLVRQRLKAVKVDPFAADDGEALLVRDEAQGFYTGTNRHTPSAVTRTMEFSRETTAEVVSYALERARRHWPDGRLGPVVMAYKFHLLDGVFGTWVAELSDRLGARIQLCQPDTVNRDLITHGLADRTVLVAGNEWADIMHVVLLDRFGGERQENRCTENVYLHPDVRGLVEYQTVHGSADDLAGRDLVNPVATVRAAAAVAERHAGCAGAQREVERALARVLDRGVATADLGGAYGTTAVLDALLAELGETGVPPARQPGAVAVTVPGEGR